MVARTSRLVLVVSCAAALVLAGCGGSSHVATGTQSPTTSAAGGSSSSSAGTNAPTAKNSTRTTATTGVTATTVGGKRAVVVPVPGTTASPKGGTSAPLVTPQGGPATTLPSGVPVTSKPTPTTVKPYDPDVSTDLSGTPGETPAEQHAAEQLLRESLLVLPRYATEQAAYNAGFRTIGDSFTGDEHMINWSYLTDNHVLDPLYPESLVYNTRVSPPKLEAAMFMLSLGQRFSDIPPLFTGPLTQWHVHNNLCFRDLGGNPDQQVVAGLTDGNGNCPAGEEKSVPVPMIHVWIVKNPCGPFAALEGIGAGQTESGTRNCDSAHAGVL